MPGALAQGAIAAMQAMVFTFMALERFQEVSRPVDILVAAATWTILLSVVAHGLSATPLSAWYARRLEAAKELPVELAGMSELRRRRSVLAGPTRRG